MVVFFFSVGCGECVGGVRSLGGAAAEAGETGTEATFLAVDMDPGESKEAIGDFLEYVEAEQVPAAIAQGAALSQRFDVAALSSLIVIDTEGKVTPAESYFASPLICLDPGGPTLRLQV